MNDQRSYDRSILKGSALSVASRWIMRLIGLVSTAILARLLSPEDFGIAAMSVIVVGLLEAVSDLGVVNLVIRSKDRSQRFVDTGWTLQVLQGAVVAAFVVLLTPVAVDYFDEPRLEAVLYVGALTVLVTGFRSIGLALARKDLNYTADLHFLVVGRLLSFFTTIGLAIWLRSYWALVYGTFLGALMQTILSYWMFPRCLRIELSMYRPFLAFSAAAIPLSVASFLTDRIGTIVVGGIANASKLGLFNVSHELASMPTKEIVYPIGRVLVPNYARLVDDPQRLAQSFLYSLQLILTAALPLSIGLSLVAEDFVLTLLGDQWTDAAELVAWLAIFSLNSGVVQVLTLNILIAIGREHLASFLYWMRFAILAPVMFFAGTYLGVLEMTIAATFAVGAMVPIALAIASRHLSIRPRQVLMGVSRQLLAATAMVPAVLGVRGMFEPALLSLLSSVLVGALVYGSALLLAWALAGRPDGVETTLLKAVRDVLRRR